MTSVTSLLSCLKPIFSDKHFRFGKRKVRFSFLVTIFRFFSFSEIFRFGEKAHSTFTPLVLSMKEGWSRLPLNYFQQRIQHLEKFRFRKRALKITQHLEYFQIWSFLNFKMRKGKNLKIFFRQ